MRNDALGLFWEDIPEIREKKTPDKREPPVDTWSGSLPYLNEAKRFEIPKHSDWYAMLGSQEESVFDCEVYPNYFCIAFQGIKTGKVWYLELNGPDEVADADDRVRLTKIMKTCALVGFNSTGYDIPIINSYLSGKDTKGIYNVSQAIIVDNLRGRELHEIYNIKRICDPYAMKHVDIMNVAPSKASLKLYGCRLHIDKVQDLPYAPGTTLTDDQKLVVLWYCVNDLNATAALRKALDKELLLRSQLTAQYKRQMLSRSDAQIAEDVIAAEIYRITSKKVAVPQFTPGEKHWYKPPKWMEFQTPLLRGILDDIMAQPFIVNDYGKVYATEALKIKASIGNTEYKLGIGGLHSCEKSMRHRASAEQQIISADVTSYYPFIILNMGLHPKHLGDNFLRVYKRLVERRLDAKRRGDKRTSDGLKISINGTFGKLASPHSILYSIGLMLTVTVTGQLTLLMLIEALELNGIKVISANTDGLVAVVKKEQKDTYDKLTAWWQQQTRFELEYDNYDVYCARDVNNYIAIRSDKTSYGKGVFGKNQMMINPVNNICQMAIEKYLCDNKPIEYTVLNHKDIKDYVSVRTVKGGAVWNGQYLGRAIRWYMSENEKDNEIVYAASGNRVPKTNGAKPIMDLPKIIPNDLDYQWYIDETYAMLKQIGWD